jgi:hypothetical protein
MIERSDCMIKLIYVSDGVKELIGNFDEIMAMISQEVKVLSVRKI